MTRVRLSYLYLRKILPVSIFVTNTSWLNIAISPDIFQFPKCKYFCAWDPLLFFCHSSPVRKQKVKEKGAIATRLRDAGLWGCERETVEIIAIMPNYMRNKWQKCLHERRLFHESSKSSETRKHETSNGKKLLQFWGSSVQKSDCILLKSVWLASLYLTFLQTLYHGRKRQWQKLNKMPAFEVRRTPLQLQQTCRKLGTCPETSSTTLALKRRPTFYFVLATITWRTCTVAHSSGPAWPHPQKICSDVLPVAAALQQHPKIISNSWRIVRSTHCYEGMQVRM